MKLTVNARAVADFVHCGAETPLLNGCQLWQYQRQLARFEQLRREFTEHAAEAVEASRFDKHVAFLGERPVEIQRQVLSHPSFAIWLHVAEGLQLREAHLRFPQLHLTAHLNDLGRFAAATALLDRDSRLNLTLRRGPNGFLALSGAGVQIPGRPHQAFRTVSLSIQDGLLQAECDRRPEPVPLTFGGIEIEGFDWSLRISGTPAFTFMSLDDAAVIQWQASLNACGRMLDRAWPAMRQEVGQGIRSIIPVAPSGPDVHASATFQETPGLTALSWTSDVDVLAEAMVHEHHHQKLNSLLATAALLNEDDGRRYYSPWRPDPRPLLGLLHGVYSFQSVVKFWCRVFQSEVPILQLRRAVQRTHQTYCQVREALDTLAGHDGLTPLGEAFVEAMATGMDEVEPLLPPISAAARERVSRSMSAHRSSWNTRNNAPFAPAPADVEAAAPTEQEQAVLDRLGLTWAQAVRSVRARDASEDEVLRRIASKLATGLARKPSSSALICLAAAHQGYAEGRFEDALQHYRQFGAISPAGSAYAASWAAFCLRQLGRWTEAQYLLGQAPISLSAS